MVPLELAIVSNNFRLSFSFIIVNQSVRGGNHYSYFLNSQSFKNII